MEPGQLWVFKKLPKPWYHDSDKLMHEIKKIHVGHRMLIIEQFVPTSNEIVLVGDEPYFGRSWIWRMTYWNSEIQTFSPEDQIRKYCELSNE